MYRDLSLYDFFCCVRCLLLLCSPALYKLAYASIFGYKKYLWLRCGRRTVCIKCPRPLANAECVCIKIHIRERRSDCRPNANFITS